MDNRNDTVKTGKRFCQICRVVVPAKSFYSHNHEPRLRNISGKGNKQETDSAEDGGINLHLVLNKPLPLKMQYECFLDQVLLKTSERASITTMILQDLEPCLVHEFGPCTPHIFGSMYTGLALIGSDIDIYLDTGISNKLPHIQNPREFLQRTVNRCARALKSDGRFSKIVPITNARVPIVKFVHIESKVSGDISFKDSLGVHNSRLLQYYLYLNPRFFEVMVLIKVWAKEFGLRGLDGLSSYGWTLLFVSFLQSLRYNNGNRVVPTVQDLQKGYPPSPWSIVNGCRVDLHPNIITVNLPKDRRFTHLGLLKGFFSYYKDFNFEQYIISPYLGEPIPWSALRKNSTGADAFRACFRWHLDMIEPFLADRIDKHRAVSIQDPFQHDFLLGGTCSDRKFQTLKKSFTFAAELCESEEKLKDPNASLFLSKLLTCVDEGRKQEIYLKVKDIDGIPKAQLCKAAFLILEEIFLKIVKLQLTSGPEANRPSGEPDMKVLKKTEEQDVHQSNQKVEGEKLWRCVAVHPVWVFRKRSRKDVKLCYPETEMEFEEKLSTLIADQNHPMNRIEFLCAAKFTDKPSLHLTLTELNANKNTKIFKDLIHFLRQNLQAWMNNFIPEKFAERSFLLALNTADSASSLEAVESVMVEAENGNNVDSSAKPESVASCGNETAREEAISSPVDETLTESSSSVNIDEI